MAIDPRLAARRRAVHAAARKAGLSETERRDIIAGQARGKRSTLDLSIDECDRVLDTIHRVYPQSRAPNTGAPKTIDREPLLTKIEALLSDMALPWSYADKIAENITGGKRPEAIKRLAWVPDNALRGVIAQLAKQHRKRLAAAWMELSEQLVSTGRPGNDGIEWCRNQVAIPGVHTADNPWSETIQTLTRLIGIMKGANGR